MATFNVNDTARRVQYTSSGQSSHTFNFQVNAISETQVHKNDTLLTEATHYNTSLNADGTTEFDEFVGTQPSMQVNSSTLAPVFENGFTTQQQMDRFNHDTTPGDAEKKVFFYAKFTTVDLGKFTGTGTVALEGAHDNVSDPSVENGTANYINTIERLEGAGTIVGKPATSE